MSGGYINLNTNKILSMRNTILQVCVTGLSLAMAQPSLIDQEAGQPSCDICLGESLVADGEVPLLNLKCSDIALKASQLSAENCTNELIPGYDASSICCENTPPPNECDLCPEEGAQLIPTRTVNSEQYGESVTCSTFAAAASFVTGAELCQSIQEEVARTCCITLSPPPDTRSCRLLCPNGSPPNDLAKVDPLTGLTCSELILEYSKFPDEESGQCQQLVTASLGFDGVAFCCPDVEPPDECSTCRPDEEFLYPERVLFSYHSHTCRVLEESLQYVVGETSCRRILDESRAELNCRCLPARERTIQPSPAPTEILERGASGSRLCLGVLGILGLTIVAGILS